MSRIKIDGRGSFIDITVPVDCAQVFLDRIKAKGGYDIDQANTTADSQVYHIRITFSSLLDMAKSSGFLTKIAHDLGMKGPNG